MLRSARRRLASRPAGSSPAGPAPVGPEGPVVIWGDGAVGRGLAVALSRSSEVVLVGPPGSGSSPVEIEASGVVSGKARVPHAEPSSAPEGGICLVAVKAYDIASIGSLVFESSPRVVCLSNGMGLEEEWGGRASGVEPCIVLGGFTALPGWRVDTHPGGFVAVEGGIAAGLLAGAGLQVELRTDIEARRWAKWLLNSSLNPVAALAGLRNDELGRHGLEPLIRFLQTELSILVPATMRDEAVGEAAEFTGFLLEFSANRCSMLQDLDAGRPTEIDYLAGLAGRRLPGRCPTAEAVTALVKARAGSLRRAETG